MGCRRPGGRHCKHQTTCQKKSTACVFSLCQLLKKVVVRETSAVASYAQPPCNAHTNFGDTVCLLTHLLNRGWNGETS